MSAIFVSAHLWMCVLLLHLLGQSCFSKLSHSVCLLWSVIPSLASHSSGHHTKWISKLTPLSQPRDPIVQGETRLMRRHVLDLSTELFSSFFYHLNLFVRLKCGKFALHNFFECGIFAPAFLSTSVTWCSLHNFFKCGIYSPAFLSTSVTWCSICF